MAADLRTLSCAGGALLGFAANSILTRLALGAGHVDAASFTGLRLLSGAAVLAVLAGRRDRRAGKPRAGSWSSAAALFLYAAPFSFAYLRIGAGAGALILFGVVQLTMIAWGIARGDRPGAAEWAGLVLASAGLVALVGPGLSAPDPLGSALMAVAGAAWGVYSLRGRGGGRPLAATADNFARTLPFAAVLAAVALPGLHAAPEGVALAVVSGGLTSGLGYSLWYAALPRLTATRAAILQLAVPALAVLGAWAFLAEPLSLRLLGAMAAILGGVALAVLRPGRGRGSLNRTQTRRG